MERRLVLEKVIINDFQGVYDALKRGFDPNEPYQKDEVEDSILWTRNKERPTLDRVVRLLDLANGKASQGFRSKEIFRNPRGKSG